MIDLHSHLLPGVDDGSPSVERSLTVLQRFEREGVEVVVCTPHLRASRAAEAPHERHRAILGELVARAPARPRLALGWEVMLDEPGADLTAPALRLDGSTAILVEFPRVGVPARGEEEIRRLRASGLVPVVAHPERYWGCTPELVRRWRAAGAAIQSDAAASLGTGRVGHAARLLLAEGLVDCLASDNHADDRSLAVARSWLADLEAEEQAALLTRANPARLLADEPPLPVAPVVLRRGALARLRDLLLGRTA